jgi:hypothetical protein
MTFIQFSNLQARVTRPSVPPPERQREGPMRIFLVSSAT